MNLPKVISQLESQGKAIAQLVNGLSVEEIHWKPDTGSWSICEVMRHLTFEEIYDFRLHLGKILGTSPSLNLEKDSDQWHAENQKQSFDVLFAQFSAERESTLHWLGALKNKNWDESIDFHWGNLSAGDLLSSWLAHDLLHLRQLIELRYGLALQGSTPYRIEYAGEW